MVMRYCYKLNFQVPWLRQNTVGCQKRNCFPIDFVNNSRVKQLVTDINHRIYRKTNHRSQKRLASAVEFFVTHQKKISGNKLHYEIFKRIFQNNRNRHAGCNMQKHTRPRIKKSLDYNRKQQKRHNPRAYQTVSDVKTHRDDYKSYQKQNQRGIFRLIKNFLSESP